ncbi:PDC sensor domain-containing protein [Helicobacter mustelae]|uniref:Putative inner membrane protein n=1 Tax=Helicobacter mustelae (strain ATCC 43772 / CCUG 25715 / CIP 103759 / LMG 18044 / NCTC 12198 / R85-136P) TaxID=679897 RepID=D3UGD9_HELM1|nr:PDC sensor domain-containing protein [Helicobacter mustelae]CBG39560.1 putative inner membrane protein [Helicobacter mustelae 12198]SQH71072.1 general glycosylation pathway protein [Helicobacter mustelae]STP12201.1 general glycosylation pathway protein [Helicobacter mustelae]
MLSRDILIYRRIRHELRAYMHYLFAQNLQNFLPSTNVENIFQEVEKIRREIKTLGEVYVLDAAGHVIDARENIKIPKSSTQMSKNFSDQAFYYEAVREKRCIVTNPYPAALTNKLIVTASYPIYDQNHHLLFVICIDLPLTTAISISSSSRFANICYKIGMWIYGLLSLVLTLICIVLFIKGVSNLYTDLGHFRDFEVDEIFKAIIQLTLALAIFDLVKAIFEVEVLGKHVEGAFIPQQTLVRFLGSIIIALAIESLMLVFKFAINEPDKILYAVYLIGAVSALLIGLAIYMKFVSRNPKNHD